VSQAVLAPAPVSAGLRAAGVGLAVVAGIGLAVQSRINSELAVRLHDPIGAALWSFGSGLVVLALLVPTTRRGRRGLSSLREALREHRIRLVQCLGGAVGGFVVATQGLAVPTLGVAVYIVAMVAGQSSAGLLVDRAGLAPGGSKAVTVPRLAGAALTFCAVVLSVADRIAHPAALALAVLPLIGGIVLSWQAAVNGHVREASGNAAVASFLNFSTGTVVLIAAFALSAMFRGLPSGIPDGPWWLFVGGMLGIVNIGLGAAIVRWTGVLLLSLGMIAGQVTGALLIDALFPAGAGHPGWNTIAGSLLTLVAVGVAVLPARRRP
jgi:bacterial/archaeal transporter family-2 protein